MDNLKNLQKIVELMNVDKLTKKEGVLIVKELNKYIQTVKDTLNKSIADISSDVSMAKKERKELLASLSAQEKKLDKMIDSLDSTDKSKGDLIADLFKNLKKLEKSFVELDILEISDVDECIKEFLVEFKNSIPENITGEDIVNKINALPIEEDKQIGVEHIKGFDKTVSDIKDSGKSIRFVGGTNGIYMFVNGSKKGIVKNLNLIAGTGITLTYVKTGNRSDILIDATGGGGGFTEVTVSGAKDDSNLIFTALTEPRYLIINGAMYKKTGGAITWSYLAGTITLSSPVGSGTFSSIYGLA